MTTPETILLVLQGILVPAVGWMAHQNASIRERLARIEQRLCDIPCSKPSNDCPKP